MPVLPYPSIEAKRVKGVRVLTDEALFGACGVRVAFTSRDGGVSEGPYASLNTGAHVGDDLSRVERNRKTALEAIGFPDVPLIVPNQVHGTDFARVRTQGDAAEAAARAQDGADAVVVDAPGVGVLLNFADCLPLVIVAPDGRFAVVHAGWRGALAGIAGMAARALADGGGSCEIATAGFNAYIGPHIRSECFETSGEVARRFADRFGDGVLAGARHVSLAGAVTRDLVAAGLAPDRIADAGICTVCNSDRYFSYRASGGTCGRHAAIAARLVPGTVR